MSKIETTKAEIVVLALTRAIEYADLKPVADHIHIDPVMASVYKKLLPIMVSAKGVAFKR